MVHFLESVSCALYWAKNELNTDNSYTSVNSHDSNNSRFLFNNRLFVAISIACCNVNFFMDHTL